MGGKQECEVAEPVGYMNQEGYALRAAVLK